MSLAALAGALARGGWPPRAAGARCSSPIQTRPDSEAATGHLNLAGLLGNTGSWRAAAQLQRRTRAAAPYPFVTKLLVRES